ncbi:energy transducer TonB [Winogradskyella algicola]|uniref:hypothetical protein n=1 Tax=Winogradskyella algicola TaxID=2575815 RepID=UPI001107D8B8|nr:hypothetical protein [Winogradskyella algicola]
MEKDIDLINAYLNNSLSETERLAFENRLKTDATFYEFFVEHQTILKGIERVELLEEIKTSKNKYLISKWLKYFGGFVLLITITIIAYSLCFSAQSGEQQSNNNTSFEVVKDSVLNETIADSISKCITVKYHKKQIFLEERTKAFGGVEIVKDTIIKEVIGSYTIEEFKSAFPKNIDFKKENDTIFVNPNLLIEFEKAQQIVLKENKNNEATKAVSKNVESFFNPTKKEAQIVTFNASEDYKVTLKEGTEILIPANAFINSKTQKEVTGNVSLEVTEYYKLSDMLLADLSTKSYDQILETGGMLYIEAKKNNSNLKLKQGKELEIVFNNKGKEDMQLFNGDKIDGVMNWNLPESIDILSSQSKSISQEVSLSSEYYENTDSSSNFEFLDVVPRHPNCEPGDNEQLKQCFNEEITKFVARKFNHEIGEKLNLITKENIYVSFEIDRRGNIGKIEARSKYDALAAEAIRVLELFPKVVPGKINSRYVNVKYRFPIAYRILGSENSIPVTRTSGMIFQQDSALIIGNKKEVQKEIEEKPISEVSKSDLERYTLSTTQLGWINCDRFINSRKNKIKYNINISNAEGANVKLIFKSMSSILPSRASNGFYDFGVVPVNEEVILLGIKKKGDKIFLGLKELRIRATSEEQDIDFKEVSLSELKKELIKLNSNF